MSCTTSLEMIVLRYKKKKEVVRKLMAMGTYFLVLVCFHAKCHCLSIEVHHIYAMTTDYEERDEDISTALRIEEVMHSNKKYKDGAPRAPFGFSPVAETESRVNLKHPTVSSL